MFSAKNQNDKGRRTSSPKDTNAVTIITSGCHFSGKLYTKGASRIGGKIEGFIVSEGLLVVEEEAEIYAEIKAEEVIIQGKVKGKLVATGRVELCPTAEFEGDITTSSLIIREGAQFNGRASMERVETANGKSSPRIIASNGKKVNGKDDPNIGKVDGGAQFASPEVNVNNK